MEKEKKEKANQSRVHHFFKTGGKFLEKGGIRFDFTKVLSLHISLSISTISTYFSNPHIFIFQRKENNKVSV